MKEHFCMCPAVGCPFNPKNHNHGCDPCIKDNIKKKKMPACMFYSVHADMSEAADYSIEGFVDYYMKHREQYPADKKKQN